MPLNRRQCRFACFQKPSMSFEQDVRNGNGEIHAIGGALRWLHSDRNGEVLNGQRLRRSWCLLSLGEFLHAFREV